MPANGQPYNQPFGQPLTVPGRNNMFNTQSGGLIDPAGGGLFNNGIQPPQQGGGFNFGAALPVIGGVGSALSSLFAPDPLRPESYDVNPGQRALFNSLKGQFDAGGGDFGGGSVAKSGYANLMQMLDARGVDPRSGAAIGAFGNVASNAAAVDAQRRDAFGQRLLGTNIQQATRYV